MGLLTSLFREKVSSKKDARLKTEAEQDVAYATGFLSFDFMNGTVVHVKTPEGKRFQYNSVGIVDGSIVMVIGRSGCGKTTFIMQSAGEIVKPFETSCIFHDDIEGGITQARKEQLIGLHGDEFKECYISRNSGITAENFYERIKMIHDLKVIENREKFVYDTDLYSTNGEKIYKLEPTVYILDSLAMLMPEKYSDEEELSGQMSATAAAKANASVFRRIVPMLKAANIILFVVNHITEKVELNAFSKTPALVSYLKPGETLPGGRNPIYLSNLLIRLDDGSKLKDSEGFGIVGSVVTLTVLKSRTTSASSSVNLIFDYEKGFDRELSLFYLLKEKGLVNGAGAYLYFGDRSDIKFSQKNFKQKLSNTPELQQVFYETAMIALTDLINDNTPNEEDNMPENDFDISGFILKQMNSELIATA